MMLPPNRPLEVSNPDDFALIQASIAQLGGFMAVMRGLAEAQQTKQSA